MSLEIFLIPEFSIFVLYAHNTKSYAWRKEDRIHIEADNYLVDYRSKEKKVVAGVNEEPNRIDKLQGESRKKINRNALTLVTGKGIILRSEAQDYLLQTCLLLMLNI